MMKKSAGCINSQKATPCEELLTTLGQGIGSWMAGILKNQSYV